VKDKIVALAETKLNIETAANSGFNQLLGLVFF